MNQNQPTQPEEMTLLELLQSIYRGITHLCKQTCHLLTQTYQLGCRKWWLILGIGILALSAALYLNRPTNRRYVAESRITLYGVDANVIQTAYNALGQASVYPNSMAQSELATLLGISNEDVKGLSRFQTFHVLENQIGAEWVDYEKYATHLDKKDTATTLVSNAMVLRFCTKRPKQIATIEEAIMRYLNSIPLAEIEYQVYHNKLETELRFQTEQINLIDSISRAFYAAQIHSVPSYTNTANTNIMVGHQELSLMNKQLNQVYYIKADIERTLSIATQPVVQDYHFVASALPALHPIYFPIKMLLFGIIIGLLAAYWVERHKGISSTRK